MVSMSYCKYENTYNELKRVWDEWEEWNPKEESQYEINARENLKNLIRDMHDCMGD